MDSNVYIEGLKGPYAFDLAPRFWELIDELTDDGRLSCPTMVYEELLDGQDALTKWSKERRTSGLFVQPEADVQEAYADVIADVVRRYHDNGARRRFLARADPWVIAHALAEDSVVVSLEQPDPPESQQVKIPNVCDEFQVRAIDTYQMLRELGVSWTR